MSLGAGQLAPAVVHVPKCGDEDLGEQLFQTLQQTHSGCVQHVEVHILIKSIGQSKFKRKRKLLISFELPC